MRTKGRSENCVELGKDSQQKVFETVGFGTLKNV
jgi:hypothetical protein